MVLIPGLIIALHELFVALNDLILAEVRTLMYLDEMDKHGTGETLVSLQIHFTHTIIKTGLYTIDFDISDEK